ncbi:uncharacterized protein M6B38_328805 [Iris pallida]|uniref:Ribosomal protein S19 n=1 Tax=Iris pallida TaxID=29817 RepID=A0AAX6H601_IRIPA|nr:uncharacterized protein M6B38_359340 [Iris pallida]KAJ6836027.1 uncharacterized protein M6B38_328805 [Iris pallida]
MDLGKKLHRNHHRCIRSRLRRGNFKLWKNLNDVVLISPRNLYQICNQIESFMIQQRSTRVLIPLSSRKRIYFQQCEMRKVISIQVAGRHIFGFLGYHSSRAYAH